MGARTGIEWTDSTWSPIRARNLATGKIGWHCEHVSEACRFCYAEGINRRLGTGLDFKPGHRADVEIFLDEKMLLAPLRWKTPRHIFVNSMTDTFAEFVKDEWLDRMFAVMALAPQHTFQCLTKRPERMRGYFVGPWSGDGVAARIADATWNFAERKQLPEPPVIYEIPVGPRLDNGEPEFGYRRMFHPKHWPLPNVWIGVSAEDQATADERIPLLLQTPAAVRFVSLEPLLGSIDLSAIRRTRAEGFMRPLDGRFRTLDWVIAGGESGAHARPSHPDWFLRLRDQCAAAEVPFFFKQWGEWAPHTVTAGGDLGGDIRAGRVRVVHPTGQTDVEVSEITGGHGTIPGSRYMARVGKKAAGRLLDGREHNGMPSALRETAQSAVQPTESS